MERHPETSTTDPITTHISYHDSIVAAITYAVAEVRKTDRDSLDPLIEAAALNTLNTLFCHSNDLEQIDLQITFTVADCKVILYGDGRIVVAPRIDDSHDISQRTANSVEHREDD